MSNEITLAETWLYSKLSHLCEGRVYSYLIPQGRPYPAILFTPQNVENNAIAVGDIRVYSKIEYLVKVISKGNDMVALKATQKAIDQILHDVQDETSDSVILSCRREKPFSFLEVQGGVAYSHLGGLYSIALQPKES